MKGFDFSKVGTTTGAVNTGAAVTSAPVKEAAVVAPAVESTKTVAVVGGTSVVEEKISDRVVMAIDEKYLTMDETALNALVNDVVDKVNKIEEELNSEFVERENEIHMLALAFVAGVNAFYHGPAGTGKSALVEEFSRRVVQSNYFRVLMGKTTEPGEVFGAVSIEEMKKGSHKVNTKGKLPEAHISFVDEVFKCNSAVLNSLLTIMNEKVFFNDGVQEVPLISVVGASNEYIEEDSLTALYDRFLLRWHVDYIQDPNNRISLFNTFLNKRKNGSVFTPAALSTMQTNVSIQELMILNEKTKEVDMSAKIEKDYNKLFINLAKKGIIISDRRKNESLKVLQASALLDGRDSVDSCDFEALKYTLWNTQDQIQVVQDEVVKIANPNATKYNQYKKVLEDYRAELEKVEAEKDAEDYAFNKTITITETVKNLQYAINTVQGIIPTLKDGSKDHKRFSGLLQEMNDYVAEIRAQVLV